MQVNGLDRHYKCLSVVDALTRERERDMVMNFVPTEDRVEGERSGYLRLGRI